MGLISLLTSFSPKIGSLVVDAAITELHEMEAEITDYPIESGEEASDNRRKLPRRYSMTGVVAASPLGIAQVTGLNRPLSVQAGFDALERLHEEDELFEMVSKLKIYKSMMISKISIERSSAQGEAIFFNAEMRQLIIVSTEQTSIRVASNTSGGASNKVKQGAKPTVPASPSTAQKSLTVIQQVNRLVGIVQ